MPSKKHRVGLTDDPGPAQAAIISRPVISCAGDSITAGHEAAGNTRQTVQEMP